MTNVLALLEELFPIGSDFFSLHWEPDLQYRPAEAHEDDLYVVVRLVCWEPQGTEVVIRDVREESVLLVPAGSRQDPRIEAWLRGWSEALTQVMKSQDLAVGRDDQEAMYADNALAGRMPSTLISSDTLELVRPQTPEDFTRVLLESKNRLGRFLFPPP